MATNLQVQANTQQAVGAFNALTASVTQANNAFARLTNTLNRQQNTNRGYANSVTAITSSFDFLSNKIGTVFDWLTKLGAAVGFVFKSLLRELDKLQGFNAIMSVTTDSAEAVTQSFNFLRVTADKLGQPFDALSSNYAKLVAALPPGVEGLRTAEKAFLGVSMAARTLHSTNQDTQLMFYAITQIASKGVVSMEELRRQLGEKLPGVMQIAAKALNTIPEKLEEAIRKGIVLSDKFLPIFGDALIRTFADSSEKASQSVSAAINRLTNVWIDFVKKVLDSGAGQSIINLFDALREKLNDTYLMERFAIMVKSIADRFTDMVKNLTADDIRNGFDTAQKFMDGLVEVLGKVVNILTWIINNGGKAGAIIGLLGGASLGAAAGPYGALVGAVGGAAGGAYLGYSLSPTDGDKQSRAVADAQAQAAASAQRQAAELFKLNTLIPMLGNFSALKSFNGIENLLKAENQNTKTLVDLNRILTSKEFKTDIDKANAVRDYAKYGVVVSPNTATLNDVIGNSKKKGKKSASERSEESTYLRAFGLDGNFRTEFDNLINLYKKKRLSVEELQMATEKLISKQPYMEAYLRAEDKALEASNKATTEMIDTAVKQVQVKESVRTQMQEELRLAGMRGDVARMEVELQKYVNQYAEQGLTVKDKQLERWREEIRIRERLRELTGIGDQILSQTVDKYKPAIDQQQAMDLLVRDPSTGFTEQSARDFTVNSDQNFQGSQQWIEAQKRALQDYYAFIDGLRSKDRISEETAEQAKAKAAAQYTEMRLQNAAGFFSTLSNLASSGNDRMAKIGRAAAIASATIDGIVAIQKAYAAPPGWPYNAANVIAVGAVTAANIQKLRGYAGGGYTGSASRGDITGVTHGQEFVVNANATARNRALLESMNAGRQVSASSGLNVEFHNYGTPQSYEVETVSDNRIRIIARDEVNKTAPKLISSQISDANSPVSQSLRTHTTAERRR